MPSTEQPRKNSSQANHAQCSPHTQLSPPPDGTTRALRVYRVSKRAVSASSPRPCPVPGERAWLACLNPLRVCRRYGTSPGVENFCRQHSLPSKTIVRRAPPCSIVLPHSAQQGMLLPARRKRARSATLSLYPLNHLSRHHFCSPRAPSMCSV